MRYAKHTVSLLLVTFSSLLWADPTPVRVAPIVFSNHVKAVIASGIVRPVSEQSLSFKVPGIVQSVNVKQGQAVKKGQLLAQLEPEELNAQVAKAQALLQDGQRKLQRLTALEGKQLASNEQIRQVKTQVQVAQSDLRIARFNLKYSKIHAPADGRILSRDIESNELVSSGQPVLVFADDSQGWSVKLAVADVDVVKLNIGDMAEIQLDAYPGETFQAKVRDIAGRAHSRTQTFTVDLNLQAERRLYSGLIAHTEIIPSMQTSVAQIPLSALIQAHGREASVYVLNDQGHAGLKEVNLAYIDTHYAYVKSGVKQGDKLVVEGGAFINDGQDIAIVNR